MTHGVVSAAQPEAAEAGALALMQGGNAVDAAIACALVQGVVDPLMCGIGGVGTAVLHMPAKGPPENFNFLGRAPAACRGDMWADRIIGETGDGFGFVLEGRVNALGHQAAMVPGNLKGYFTMHQAHGVLPWAEICAAAITVAEDGWVVRPHVYTYATQDEGAQGRVHNSEILGFTAEGTALYLDDGGVMKRPGKIIENAGLAESLRQIARDGAAALYGGALGQVLVADMAANGGLISLEDLRNYEVSRQPVLQGSYRGYDLATNQPGGSGVQVLETLNILENFEFAELDRLGPECLRILAEAIAYAYNDKRQNVGDPDFVDVPLAQLLDKTHAGEIADRIKAGEKGRLDRLPSVAESKDTTHVCAWDEDGNAFSMTHTLGAPSGVIPPGGGYILNGCMGIFDPRPNRPTSILPGKSYTSSMSPLLMYRDGELCLVIGAPGASYIPQAITQTIFNCIDYDMALLEAVATPRVAVTKDLTIDVVNRIPKYVTAKLEDAGYAINRSYLSHGFAGVHGIAIVDGKASGVADPGRDGMALTV
jgi:gamma-glutamyltranspeptidase/glutathione hydrolase